MQIEEPAVKKLLAENEAFQRLWSRHLQYEQQLAGFDRLPHLSSEQELERRTVQKLKLAGKDEMAVFVRKAAGR